MGQGLVSRTSVTVVDTPGWSLYGQAKSINSFTEKHRAKVEKYLGVLGDDIWGKMLVLFTFGDDLKGKSIEEYMTKQGPALQWVMERCGHRHQVIETSLRCEDQLEQLMEKILLSRCSGGVKAYKMLASALVCGAVVFPGLFFSFRAVLRRMFPKWTEADVVCVSERLLSAVHGSLATAAGSIVVMSCKDIMNDNHWLVNAFAVFGASYMTFDLYAMYLSHFHSQKSRDHSKDHSLQTVRDFLHKNWMLVLHHVALLSIFLPITVFFRRGLGDFFIGCFFITEFSSPFISIGKILIQLGLDDTSLHYLNGLAVLLTFFICRILIFPLMYWTYGQQFGIPLYKVPFHLPLHCNLGNVVILAPQIYWFILLVKKAKRLYLRHKKVTEKDEKEKQRTD